MTKMLAFIMFLLPTLFGFAPSAEMAAATCNCDSVANVQKTGQTDNSISYAWSATTGATQYRVWYHRQEGQYTSGVTYTSGTSHTFANLAPGHYTFYFVAECGGDVSSMSGIEDIVQL